MKKGIKEMKEYANGMKATTLNVAQDLFNLYKDLDRKFIDFHEALENDDYDLLHKIYDHNKALDEKQRDIRDQLYRAGYVIRLEIGKGYRLLECE